MMKLLEMTGGVASCKNVFDKTVSWKVLLVILVCHFVLSSALQKQSHQGSAPTNEFTLTGSRPDARVQIDSSSQIIIIKIDAPSNNNGNPYKVSLELLAMQLCDPAADDRLKVVYSDPSTIKTATWKVNVSFPSTYSLSEDDLELKDIQANEIVLIPEGRWVKSTADLVATLYQDATADGTCPDNTISCNCSSRSLAVLENHVSHSKEASFYHRCIPKVLLCNGKPNCGLRCWTDESDSQCPSSSPLASSSSVTPCSTPEPPPSSSPTAATTAQDGGYNGGGISSLFSSFGVTFNIVLMTIATFVIR